MIRTDQLEALEAMIERTSLEEVLDDLHTLIVARAAKALDKSRPQGIERTDDQVKAYQVYLYWDSVGQYLDVTKGSIEGMTEEITEKLGRLAFQVKSG